jgi:hypothetical protein
VTGTAAALIDDFGAAPRAANGAVWALVSDGVMGGLSSGRLEATEIGGRRCLRMTGRVRLENDGGFLQMALDLSPGGGLVDASGLKGIAVTVRGNGEAYGVHLRTAHLARPWQSYRAGFVATMDWTEQRLPFAGFVPHRTDVPFDPARLRRIGLVAIGRAFEADLAVAELRFF